MDFLIIGQGISGTWLSYWLYKEQRSFLVLDDKDPLSPSRISAGVINPITGRRHVSVWMAEDLLPFAETHYGELGNMLGINGLSVKKLIDFFPTPQMRQSFVKRTEEYGDYVSLPGNEISFHDDFNYEFGYGEVRPVYTAHLEKIIPAWRLFLLSKQLLAEEKFNNEELELAGEKCIYKGKSFSHIIFCDGNQGALSPWFHKLPYALNKGEILLADIPELPTDNIYKRSVALVPLAEKGNWWIGSNYAWEFKDADPTARFREETEAMLKKWLKHSFTITDHIAGLRPATLERRPFVGTHPVYPSVAILNGMGSKGCSLAPYFARQLVDHLLHGKDIHPEADVRRFKNLLSR